MKRYLSGVWVSKDIEQYEKDGKIPDEVVVICEVMNL
jgi:hypothetical protein